MIVLYSCINANCRVDTYKGSPEHPMMFCPMCLMLGANKHLAPMTSNVNPPAPPKPTITVDNKDGTITHIPSAKPI